MPGNSRLIRRKNHEDKAKWIGLGLLFRALIGVGLVVKATGNVVFPLFIAFLSLSATAVSVRYAIAPNIIIFGCRWGRA